MATLTKWYDSSLGNSGWDTGIPCQVPDCYGKIVYNGNYFCTNYGYTFAGKDMGGPCDFALSLDETGKPVRKIDRAVWKKIKALNSTERV